VQLELEGRYSAMLSHEPKNYVLLGYDGSLTLRGVAFRSSRSEPFGDRFLRHALARLLVGDVAGVRDVYVETVARLRARAVPTHDVSSLVRLTKEPAEYLETRARRRELAYEALLAAGRSTWRVGDRVRVYRKQNGEGGLAESPDEDAIAADPRDYDAEYYVRLLRSTYAERLARAFTAEDFAVVFADADQFTLFSPSVQSIRPVLRTLPSPGLR
jgi:DNA polymerase elongation subunit (family B)